eukprot:GHVL01004099.1.p1 GENE.GHVL01004099.1~~GHVL01004099.1.p1  ORF type:complete len:1619 (+),score=290.61 GHVL01004099.1:310-4857(+)
MWCSAISLKREDDGFFGTPDIEDEITDRDESVDNDSGFFDADEVSHIEQTFFIKEPVEFLKQSVLLSSLQMRSSPIEPQESMSCANDFTIWFTSGSYNCRHLISTATDGSVVISGCNRENIKMDILDKQHPLWRGTTLWSKTNRKIHRMKDIAPANAFTACVTVSASGVHIEHEAIVLSLCPQTLRFLKTFCRSTSNVLKPPKAKQSSVPNTESTMTVTLKCPVIKLIFDFEKITTKTSQYPSYFQIDLVAFQSQLWLPFDAMKSEEVLQKSFTLNISSFKASCHRGELPHSNDEVLCNCHIAGDIDFAGWRINRAPFEASSVNEAKINESDNVTTAEWTLFSFAKEQQDVPVEPTKEINELPIKCTHECVNDKLSDFYRVSVKTTTCEVMVKCPIEIESFQKLCDEVSDMCADSESIELAEPQMPVCIDFVLENELTIKVLDDIPLFCISISSPCVRVVLGSSTNFFVLIKGFGVDVAGDSPINSLSNNSSKPEDLDACYHCLEMYLAGAGSEASLNEWRVGAMICDNKTDIWIGGAMIDLNIRHSAEGSPVCGLVNLLQNVSTLVNFTGEAVDADERSFNIIFSSSYIVLPSPCQHKCIRDNDYCINQRLASWAAILCLSGLRISTDSLSVVTVDSIDFVVIDTLENQPRSVAMMFFPCLINESTRTASKRISSIASTQNPPNLVDCPHILPLLKSLGFAVIFSSKDIVFKNNNGSVKLPMISIGEIEIQVCWDSYRTLLRASLEMSIVVNKFLKNNEEDQEVDNENDMGDADKGDDNTEVYQKESIEQQVDIKSKQTTNNEPAVHETTLLTTNNEPAVHETTLLKPELTFVAQDVSNNIEPGAKEWNLLANAKHDFLKPMMESSGTPSSVAQLVSVRVDEYEIEALKREDSQAMIQAESNINAIYSSLSLYPHLSEEPFVDFPEDNHKYSDFLTPPHVTPTPSTDKRPVNEDQNIQVSSASQTVQSNIEPSRRIEPKASSRRFQDWNLNYLAGSSETSDDFDVHPNNSDGSSRCEIPSIDEDDTKRSATRCSTLQVGLFGVTLLFGDHFRLTSPQTKPNNFDRLKLELTKLVCRLYEFDPGGAPQPTQSSKPQLHRRLVLSIDDICILDRVAKSNFDYVISLNSFALGDIDGVRKRKRVEGLHMLHLVVEELVFSNFKHVSPFEYCVHLSLLPLHLSIDQDTLELIMDFFIMITIREATEHSISENVVEDRQETVNEPESNIFFRKVFIDSLVITADYKSKRIDVSALKRRDYFELINLIPLLENLRVVLRTVRVYNTSGFEAVGACVAESYQQDMDRSQILRCVAGLTPIRSFVSIAEDFSGLISASVGRIRAETELTRHNNIWSTSFRRFLQRLTVETINLTEQAASSTSKVLDQIDGRLRPAAGSTDNTDSYNGPQQDESDWVRVEQGAQGYWQPMSVREGVQTAGNALWRGVVEARFNLIEDVRNTANATSSVDMFVNACRIPVCVIRPVVGVTSAIGSALQGVRNSVDPESIRGVQAKYRRPRLEDT